MKNLFPSDPAADKAALLEMAGGKAQQNSQPTKDYVNESVEVPQGSMPIDLDLAGLTALAGVRLDETQKTGSAGQLKSKDAFTKSSKPGGNESPHPARNKLVGEDDQDLAEPLFVKDEPKDAMSQAQRQLKQGMELIAKGSAMIDEAQAKIKEFTNTLSDRTLTKDEEKEKERIVKGMKKKKSDFKDRYGDDADAVMYATATKNAKKTTESIKERLYRQLSQQK